ncbi:MAG TPA: ABC transporter permease [Candidatus Sulfomarinibacteraceae bacterium]|nr:ABC transporter permease [Candidatus Sulfomarinibacteraceae bacterium]
MTLADAFRTALDNLAGHKLRSALTMLGMIFGVGAVIAMLSIGEGAEREAMAMIERLGVRNILVRDVEMRDEDLQEVREKSPGVSPRDAVAIADAVPGVERTCPRTTVEPHTVSAAGRTADATAHGVGSDYADLTSLDLARGRFLDAFDVSTHAQVCVIGEGVRRQLFGAGQAIGSPLKVNELWLEVVGVLAPAGRDASVQGVALGSTDLDIYLPVSTAIRKLDLPLLEAPLDEIIVRLADDANPVEAARLADELLDRLHGGEDDYELVVPEALLEQSRKTQRLFNIVMGAIAGISLLVGGIGIANIMLATVFERTREIGVRRAMGARRDDIRTLFLMESFAISVLGGVAGVVLGLVISKVVAASAGWSTVVTLWSVLLAFGVSMAVGIGSGLYPALRAATLNPIDALRWE